MYVTQCILICTLTVTLTHICVCIVNIAGAACVPSCIPSNIPSVCIPVIQQYQQCISGQPSAGAFNQSVYHGINQTTPWKYGKGMKSTYHGYQTGQSVSGNASQPTQCGDNDGVCFVIDPERLESPWAGSSSAYPQYVYIIVN
jgi:hypothetical protein